MKPRGREENRFFMTFQEVLDVAVTRFNDRGLLTLSKRELRDAVRGVVASTVYGQIGKRLGAEKVSAEVLQVMRQDIEEDRNS